MTLLQQIQQLPNSEKLVTLESLWGEFAIDDFPSPKWHEGALKATKKDITWHKSKPLTTKKQKMLCVKICSENRSSFISIY